MTRTLNCTVEAGGKLYPAGTPEADVDGLVEREDVWDGDPEDEAPEAKPTRKGQKTS